MRIREVNLEKGKGLLIYMTEEEHNDNTIKDKLTVLASKYKNISIFISGTEDIRKVLKQILSNKLKEQ